VPDPDDSQRDGGISGALSRFAGSVVALLRTRVELATVEFHEESERAKEMLFLVVLTTSLGLFALLFVSLFVIVYFWDSNRLAAAGAVAVFYIVVAVAAFVRLRQRLSSRASPFAATLAELEHDVAAFRSKP